VIIDNDPLLPELRKHGRGLPHLLDHLTHPLQKATVVQRRLADIDPESAQLARLSTQAGRVGDDPDRDRAIGRRHPAHRITADQDGPCS